jgi:hypothetical protein
MLPEMEKVLASFIYINPSDAAEYIPKLFALNELVCVPLIFVLRKVVLKFVNEGATLTAAKAKRLLFNVRFSCKLKGAGTTVAFAPLEKLKLVETPAYLVTNHFLFGMLSFKPILFANTGL